MPSPFASVAASAATSFSSNRRYAGRGPRFIKLGRMVRYRNTDIDAYLRANTRGQVA